MHKSPQRGPKSISHRQLMAAQGLLASRGHQDLLTPGEIQQQYLSSWSQHMAALDPSSPDGAGELQSVSFHLRVLGQVLSIEEACCPGNGKPHWEVSWAGFAVWFGFAFRGEQYQKKTTRPAKSHPDVRAMCVSH